MPYCEGKEERKGNHGPPPPKSGGPYDPWLNFLFLEINWDISLYNLSLINFLTLFFLRRSWVSLTLSGRP